MTFYDTLKIIHILSASVLFGTGMGTAFYMILVNFQKDVLLIAKATAADSLLPLVQVVDPAGHTRFYCAYPCLLYDDKPSYALKSG